MLFLLTISIYKNDMLMKCSIFYYKGNNNKTKFEFCLAPVGSLFKLILD